MTTRDVRTERLSTLEAALADAKTPLPPESAEPPPQEPIREDSLSTTLAWSALRASERAAAVAGAGLGPRFRIGRRIGAGGFAEVFEADLQKSERPEKSEKPEPAEQPEPGPRRVALKRLLPALRSDPGRQRLLRREAEIAAQLSHPNIVRVLGLWEHDDEPLLAMELVEGLQANHLLHRLAQRGRKLNLRAIAHVMHGLFSALRYLQRALAHGRSLVHADISLENLMLTQDGLVKLIDFGVAGQASRAEAGLPGDGDEAFTSLHQLAGKRPYLPPEGAPRAPSVHLDLYAAGVCLWELCAGCRFPGLPRGASAREMGSLIAFAAEGLPRQAWLLLKSCLAVDPTSRLVAAEQALPLLAELGGGAVPAASLGKLVRAAAAQPAVPSTGLPLLPDDCTEPYDLVAALLLRLHGAFCAHRVRVYRPLGGEPADRRGVAEFALQAVRGPGEAGEGGDGHPQTLPRPMPQEVLRAAYDSGYLEAADGALLFRVRPPAQVPHLFVIEPGSGFVYDALAQEILRNLLCPAPRG